MTAFDRKVLDAMARGEFAQQIVASLGLPMTEVNIARVLRSMTKLELLARRIA